MMRPTMEPVPLRRDGSKEEACLTLPEDEALSLVAALKKSPSALVQIRDPEEEEEEASAAKDNVQEPSWELQAQLDVKDQEIQMLEAKTNRS